MVPNMSNQDERTSNDIDEAGGYVTNIVTMLKGRAAGGENLDEKMVEELCTMIDADWGDDPTLVAAMAIMRSAVMESAREMCRPGL